MSWFKHLTRDAGGKVTRVEYSSSAVSRSDSAKDIANCGVLAFFVVVVAIVKFVNDIPLFTMWAICIATYVILMCNEMREGFYSPGEFLGKYLGQFIAFLVLSFIGCTFLCACDETPEERARRDRRLNMQSKFHQITSDMTRVQVESIMGNASVSQVAFDKAADNKSEYYLYWMDRDGLYCSVGFSGVDSVTTRWFETKK